MNLHQQRCLNHDLREAVARCPQCGQFYCRECITEHDDQVICAACLRKSIQPAVADRRYAALAGHLTALLVSLLFCWIVFYWLGRILLLIPNSYHDQTLWQS